MKLTIESTDEVTFIEGRRVRIWTGLTEKGIPCFVFVTGLAVREDEDFSPFQQELQETLPPSFGPSNPVLMTVTLEPLKGGDA